MGNIVTNYGVRPPAIIPDPGDAGAINPISGSCAIVSAGAETRSLAIPTRLNEELTIFFQTDGGDVTITVDTSIDLAGEDTITLSAAGESITLRSAWNGSAFCWRVAWNDLTGANSGTTSDIGAALS